MVSVPREHTIVSWETGWSTIKEHFVPGIEVHHPRIIFMIIFIGHSSHARSSLTSTPWVIRETWYRKVTEFAKHRTPV